MSFLCFVAWQDKKRFWEMQASAVSSKVLKSARPENASELFALDEFPEKHRPAAISNCDIGIDDRADIIRIILQRNK